VTPLDLKATEHNIFDIGLLEESAELGGNGGLPSNSLKHRHSEVQTT
jgi:hypothetical protein